MQVRWSRHGLRVNHRSLLVNQYLNQHDAIRIARYFGPRHVDGFAVQHAAIDWRAFLIGIRRGLRLTNFTAGAGGLGGGSTASSFTWDFGDGQGAFTTGASTNHRYTAPGTYVASVTARTPAGNSGVGQLTVRVNP